MQKRLGKPTGTSWQKFLSDAAEGVIFQGGTYVNTLRTVIISEYCFMRNYAICTPSLTCRFSSKIHQDCNIWTGNIRILPTWEKNLD